MEYPPIASDAFLNHPAVKLHEEYVRLHGPRHPNPFKLVDARPEAKNTSDDEIYQTFPELRQKLPRGLCYVVQDNRLLTMVCGIPKFGYWTPEDRVLYQRGGPAFSVDSFSVVWLMEKVNGEMMHFSALPSKSPNHEDRLIVVGSKNVHMIVNVPDDKMGDTETLISICNHLYKGTRYSFARAMLLQLSNEWKQNAALQANWTTFLDFLATNQYTAVAEACDAARMEHLVRYERPCIYWIGYRSYNDRAFFPTTPPAMHNTLAQWGCLTPHLTECRTPMQLAEGLNKYKHAPNSEGCVVYEIDPATGEVVFLGKHKNAEYVWVRAMRQVAQRIAGSPDTFVSPADAARTMKDRFHDFHQPLTEEQRSYAARFCAWVFTQVRQKPEFADQVRSQFMKVKDQFDTLAISDALLSPSMPDSRGHFPLLTVVGSPCPGCGKTTLTQWLKQVWTEMGCEVIVVASDDFVHLGTNKRQGFLNALANTFQKVKRTHDKHPQTKQVVIVDKFNNYQNRQDLCRGKNNARQIFARRVFVGVASVQEEKGQAPQVDLPSTIDMALDRVMKRTAHPALGPDSELVKQGEAAVRGLLTQMASDWSVPREEEEYDDVTVFSMTMELEEAQTQVQAWARREVSKEITQRPMVPIPPTLPPGSYYAVKLDNDIVLPRDVMDHLKLTNQQPRPSLHVTLAYRPSAEEHARWKPWLGCPVQLTASTWAVDSQCLAIKIDTLSPLASRDIVWPPLRANLHITTWTSPHTRPVYANELVTKQEACRVLSSPFMCQGIVQWL